MRRRLRISGVVVALLLAASACGDGQDATLRNALDEVDERLRETRAELADERERSRDLERELTRTQNALDAATATTTTTTTTTTTVPDGEEPDGEDPDGEESDPSTGEDPPPPTTTVASETEAIFRFAVALDPSPYEVTRCDEDVDCIVDKVLEVCTGLLEGDVAALGRLSEYSPSFEEERALVDAALSVFCPQQKPLQSPPPVVLQEGRFAVSTEPVAPSSVPPGSYEAPLDRGADCFWLVKESDGEITIDEFVQVADRAITVTITIAEGQELTTFGCGHWRFLS